jgi:hypothetical protein
MRKNEVEQEWGFAFTRIGEIWMNGLADCWADLAAIHQSTKPFIQIFPKPGNRK